MKQLTTSTESSAVTDGKWPGTPQPPEDPSAAAHDPWVVFGYEVEQFEAMWKLLEDGYEKLPLHMQNAVVENALLHARILADILLSRGKKDDDINLSDLLPGFRSPTLDKLRCAYGKSCKEGTPCWTINKRLAHATSHRGSNYNYTQLLNQLAPLLCSVVQKVNGQLARTKRRKCS